MYGEEPSVPASVDEYGAVFSPAVKVGPEEIVGTALRVIDRLLETIAPFASVTVTDTDVVPACRSACR